MLISKNLYNSILVRGRRSNPTFEQVRKETREANNIGFQIDIYRS